MATKKDLVEAYTFSRRRLVTAFVSGAPGGREVEPVTPTRSLVAGVALAVLLLAGAAIGGIFGPKAPEDWDEAGLVVDADSGALYVVLDEPVAGSDEPRLRAVVNVTSAQLILGSDEEAEDVPAEAIADQPKGPPIGIIGAPATVPAPADLVATGWTSCTGSGLGVTTAITGADAAPPVAESPRTGLTVRSDGRLYLVATAPAAGEVPERAYAYPMPDNADALASAVGADQPSAAVEVPPRWLALFPTGPALDAGGLDITGAGRPVPADRDAGLPGSARVGDHFVADDGSAYLVTAAGVEELSPFDLDVVRSVPLTGYRSRELTVRDLAAVDFGPGRIDALPLPEDDVTGLSSPDDEVCAVLHAEEGSVPAVAIGLAPEGEASARRSRDEQPSASGGPVDEVNVTSGRGAVVWAGGWESPDGLGRTLVDDRGMAYPLVGGDAADNLGYGELAEVAVPDSWLELFEAGPELSVDAALCPPTTDGSQRCE